MKKMLLACVLSICIGGLISISGCSSSARIIATQATSDVYEITSLEGEGLFSEKCGMCHRERGMGTGILERRMSAELALLENRADLTPEFIKLVVRNGFGTMFSLSRIEVSNQQLDAIVKHLSQ